jgi:D-3-phosphoglycerate dehydrogenase
MLRGKTLGIIGMGRIGNWMARYASAFGMEVLGHDPHVVFPDHVERTELRDLLGRSDFVSVHVNLTPETQGFLSRELIFQLKPGAVFINTSRGELVDEVALVDALAEGRLAAVGADVLGLEPEIHRNPLWNYARTHDNVIITPHIGGFCPEAVDKVVAFSAKRILDHFGLNSCPGS